MPVDTPTKVSPESNTAWPWDTHPLAIIYARVPIQCKLDDSIDEMRRNEGKIERASARFCFENDQMIIRIEAESVPKLIQFAYYFRGYGLSLTLNGRVMDWEEFRTHLLLLNECVTLITYARNLLKVSMTPERKQIFIELYKGLYCALRHSKEMQFSIRMLNLSILQLGDIDPPAEALAPRLSDLKDEFIRLLNDISPNWRQSQTEDVG